MSELMLEIGGRRADGASNGKLWIGRDFAESGWWDSPETLYDEETQQDGDGAYDPVTVTVGPKRVNLTLLADASSPEWAELDVRTWAASLAKRTDLGFRVYHAGRWLSLREAKVRGTVRVRPNRRDLRLTDIILTVWSADSRKYGEPRQVTVEAIASTSGGLAFPIVEDALDFGTTGVVDFPGVFRIPNRGTADFYPTFTVVGPLSSFTITSETYTIEYDAPVAAGQTLTINPYAGGRAYLDGADVTTNLTQSDWVPVEGGQTRGYMFSPVDPGAGAVLRADYYEGAYL